MVSGELSNGSSNFTSSLDACWCLLTPHHTSRYHDDDDQQIVVLLQLIFDVLVFAFF